MACHFIALLVHALVELEIRRAMAARDLAKIPLYPEHRPCESPSAVRIFEVFGGSPAQHLTDTGGAVGPDLRTRGRQSSRPSFLDLLGDTRETRSQSSDGGRETVVRCAERELRPRSLHSVRRAVEDARRKLYSPV